MDDLLTRFEKVEKEIDGYKSAAIRVEAELDQLKKRLADLHEQAKVLGVDPENIDEVIDFKRVQIRSLIEALELKISDFEKQKQN